MSPAILVLLLQLCFTVMQFRSTEAQTKPLAVFAFGDSIFDTGNNNFIPTLERCNFPPYGRDFPGGIPTGRFGNGRVLSDLLAEGLGVKPLLPAYLDPKLSDQDLRTGVCFASGGSGLDPRTNAAQRVLSTTDQLNLFKEYISKLQRVVGENEARNIISNSQIFISTANNDFRLFGDVPTPAYADQLVRWASDFVEELYGLGARRIGFLGALPFGCLPTARSSNPSRQCVEFANLAANDYNTRLASALSTINTSLRDANILYVDFYNVALALFQNYQQAGFEVADRGCITGIPCPDASKYLFWDLLHPTQRSYQVIAPGLLNKHSDNFARASNKTT